MVREKMEKNAHAVKHGAFGCTLIHSFIEYTHSIMLVPLLLVSHNIVHGFDAPHDIVYGARNPSGAAPSRALSYLSLIHI